MDKRIEESIRVKNQIATAFVELLKENTVEDAEMITISQITTRAKVSRMAYYRNFKSKVDIIKYYLYETLWREFEKELPPDHSFWSIEYGTMFFKQMKRHREDILVLKLHGYADLILSAFNLLDEELIGDMPRNSIKRYKIYYAAGASYNAMLCWLEDGCKETPEELSKDFISFIKPDE